VASSSTGSPASAGASAPAWSAGTVFVANVAPVGHPGALDDAIAVVGPVAPGGTAALSSSAAGIPQGLASAFGRAARGARGLNSGSIEGLVEVPEPVGGGAEDGPVVRIAADLPPLPEGPSPSQAPVAAPAAGLVGRLTSWLAGLMPSRPSPSTPGRASLDDAALAAVGGASAPVASPEGTAAVESADLTGPLGLGFVALAVAHSQRRFVGWLGRRRAPAIARLGGAIPSGPRRPVA
jgi:hypothetical protein